MKHIIIFEDERDLREALMLRLEHTGVYSCSGASTPEDTLLLLKNNDPSILPVVMLIDIMIKGNARAGLELIEKIRENSEWAKIQLIVLSARSQSEIILEALGLGANDYLIKPCKKDDLLSRIERACDIVDFSNEYIKSEDTDDGLRPDSSKINSISNSPTQDDNKELRKLHVVIMKTSVLYWELNQQKNKSELAAESGLWSTYIDDNGHTRSQTIIRYLQEHTLPKKLKSNLVINTAQFVLDQCSSDPVIRPRLEDSLNKLRLALVEQV